jgi:hypothetical protein
MKWFVDEGTGKIVGPFNRLAAENFLKTGKAPANAKLLESMDLQPGVIKLRVTDVHSEK